MGVLESQRVSILSKEQCQNQESVTFCGLTVPFNLWKIEGVWNLLLNFIESRLHKY